MSNSGNFTRISGSIAAVIRTPLWGSLVVAEAVLALVATALIVLSEDTNAPGLDSGRMALSFTVLLTLAFALFTIPAIVDRVRKSTGGTGVVDALVTSALVGISLVIAAAPALLWAILATTVHPAVWLSAIGALLGEVALVIIVVTVAFSSIRDAGTATGLSYGAIVSLIVVPFLVLGVTAVLPGEKQTTTYYYIDWGKDGDVEVDPETGWPIDPTCPTPTSDTRIVPRYDLVWGVASVIPFAFVAESVEPVVAEFVNTMYMSETEPITDDTPKSTAAIDLFTSISLSTRVLQIPPGVDIVINECERIEAGLDPYVYNAPGGTPQELIASTQSGFVPGLIGQAAISGAWVVGMLVIPRLRRRK